MHARAIACLISTINVLISLSYAAPRDAKYDITFLHVNDIHARLDEFRPGGTSCVAGHECVGGYARLKSKIDGLRKQYPDSLLLDAGDEWQGTLFFSYYNDGSRIAETLNMVGIDALTLGNHEFDEGDDKLGAYLQNLTFPILSANLQTTSPALVNAKILPYTLFPKHSLAVIGLTTPETPRVSSPSQQTTFTSPSAALSAQILAIKLSHPEIKRFVALTHLGYREDIALAKQSTDVHVILGGHSHTLLGDMPYAKGAYPTVVKNAAGQNVLVATAYRYGEYLGRLSVRFAPDNTLASWDGAPIRMTQDLPQDARVRQKVIEWRAPFSKFSREIVGHVASTALSNNCQYRECSLGNLVCDVMVAFRNSGGETAQVDGAVFNAGGIRTPVGTGPVSRQQIMEAFPFANSVVELDLTGRELWSTFSSMFDGVNDRKQKIGSYLQVSSEFEITFDPTAAVGSRLISLALSGTPVVPFRTYRIATNDFVATGGDFFFPSVRQNASTSPGPNLGAVDELVIKYLHRHDPYTPPVVGRRLRDVTLKPSEVLDLEAPAATFPVEDAAWTGLAIMAACLMFVVLGLEYVVRDAVF